MLFSFWTVIFVVIEEEETFLIKSKNDENDNLMTSENENLLTKWTLYKKRRNMNEKTYKV